MYFKLALRNVKKSYKDYLIYFLTLAFSVCLFYTFNSFQEQQAVMQLSETQDVLIETLMMLITFVSIFVIFVLAFLILYANNFLIKRRKKELGLYTLLGMPRAKISKILVYETFIIGIISLIVGMLTGLVLSQILTAVTANMFDVVLNYTFVFSEYAMFLTIISFSIIFIIIMIFNTFVLNRYKLIDLMNADRKGEVLRIKNVWVSLIIFFVSIACLGYAYYKGIDEGAMAFASLGSIILAGSVGTVLFFMSLAGFLLTVLKTNKNIYFRKLNCFVLRQVNSNINSNFISMSIVCIMLLMSIGALSTGLNLNATINTTVKNSTPYDFSYQNTQLTKMIELYPNTTDNIPLDLEENVQRLGIDQSNIKSQSYTYMYDSDLTYKAAKFKSYMTKKDMKAYFDNMENQLIQVTPLSSYNKIMKALGKDELKLDANEAYLYGNQETIKPAINKLLDVKPTLTIFQQQVKIINDSDESISLSTSDTLGGDSLVLVVNDQVIPKDAQLYRTNWNVDLKDPTKDVAFSKHVIDRINAYNSTHDAERFMQEYHCVAKSQVIESMNGMSVTFTYIGIYLGTVFMIASAVILALQQLSQANDNKKRYLILSKIGADKKIINQSIFFQISIYFMMPLLLAIAHSFVGIYVVNALVMFFGKGDMFVSSLFTGGIILLIYGSYFLVTYAGYKNILKN